MSGDYRVMSQTDPVTGDTCRVNIRFERAPNGALLIHGLSERRVSKRQRKAGGDIGWSVATTMTARVEPVEFEEADLQMSKGGTLRPNRERITLALNHRSLYGPEVDEALGVEEPTVDQWESGEVIPTTEDIGRLARLTGFMPRWFYGATLPEPNIGFMCGRRDKCVPIAPDPEPQPSLRPVCSSCGCTCSPEGKS